MELASEVDLIRDKYSICPDCGHRTISETVWFFDSWFAVVSCECGWFVELELGAPNEAEVRY